MRKLVLSFVVLCLTTLVGLYANEEIGQTMTTENEKIESVPDSLYKVISMEDWIESQKKACVQLSSADTRFIHLATEEQLDKIIQKYWKDASEFVVLKVQTNKLPGELAHETNPNGSNKYYHLYNGNIPLEAVVDTKIVKQ